MQEPEEKIMIADKLLSRLEIDSSITIARVAMEKLFSGGERDQAKGAEKVWSALVNAKNTAQTFDSNVINFPLKATDCSTTFHRGV